MTTQPFDAVKKHLTTYIDVANQHHEVTITRGGVPVAVLVSHEKWERIKNTLEIHAEPDVDTALTEPDRARTTGQLINGYVVRTEHARRATIEGTCREFVTWWGVQWRCELELGHDGQCWIHKPVTVP